MLKHQSKIEQLIAELCPEGVVVMPLGDTLLPKDNIKWQSIGDQVFQYIDLTSVDRVTHKISETQTINAETAPSRAQQIVKTGDVIFGTTRPTLKRFSIIDSNFDGQICSTGFCVLRPDTNKVLTNFIYHLIGSSDFFGYVDNTQKGASYPAISDAEVKKFQIPIPPLPIQEEIVKILDTFTELEAELELELESRKKQYEYYRNHVLTFDETEVPLSELGDVYEFQYGKGNTIPKTGGKFPVYGSNGIVGSHDEFNSEDAPVIGHIGAYAGIVNWGSGKHFVTYNGVICRIKNGINPRYGYHLLKKQNLRELAKDGSQPFVSYDKLHSVKVQVPIIEKQTEIAKLLDRFDALVNDISIGLPAELNARCKQYEYYRNNLLTFSPLEGAHAS